MKTKAFHFKWLSETHTEDIGVLLRKYWRNIRRMLSKVIKK